MDSLNKVLELKNIEHIYYSDQGEVKTLQNFNLELHKGEIVGIVGPSGSGKTTILNIIAKLLIPTTGDVVVNGKVGYMLQKDNLLEWRNIYKNLIIGLEIEKKVNEENINYIHTLLSKYGLSDFMTRYPSELSGGMRQRIALIRTLAVKPDILLLDEAFSALDYQTRLEVCEDVYKIIKEQNVSTILVTHDISEAISMCDRIIVLSKRPATIKKEYVLNEFKLKSPLEIRKHPLFSHYFENIWKDLRCTNE